jgi:hypothetical protein
MSSDSNWPTFLILGAPRSGTTFLFQALAASPQVYASPVKEPLYFYAPPGGKWPRPEMATDQYQNLFDGARPGQQCGEASTLYLYDSRAAERIAEVLPDAKMIAILRDPVERAFSHYTLHRMVHRESSKTFTDAIAAEENGSLEGGHPAFMYLRLGLYGEQIRRYLDRFPREQLLFIRYRDLSRDPARVIRRTLEFLGVSPVTGEASLARVNAAKTYRVPGLAPLLESPAGKWLRARTPQRLRDAVQARVQTPRATLDPAIRKSLVEYFRDDVGLTERLLEWDLHSWLEVRPPRNRQSSPGG